MSEVFLYVYDLSAGLARKLSKKIMSLFPNYFPNCMRFNFTLEDQEVDGIWHTSVVVFGKEYAYGTSGITESEPVSIHNRCD